MRDRGKLCDNWEILYTFFDSAVFFSRNQLFQKKKTTTFQVCQKNVKQFEPRPARLICVQTVYKYFQRTALVGKELK